MILIKLITLLIAGVAISKSYIDFRKKREVLAMFIFWTVVWCVAVLLILFPQIVDRIAELSSGNSVTVGSVTGLAYVFMLYIVYRVYTKAARIEYQQTELIRKLGLAKGLKSKRE